MIILQQTSCMVAIKLRPVLSEALKGVAVGKTGLWLEQSTVYVTRFFLQPVRNATSTIWLAAGNVNLT